MAYITGYYAQTPKPGGVGRSTNVHVAKDGKPICGYRPHESYKFQWCAHGIYAPYIECKRCKEISLELEKKDLEIRYK